MTAELVKTAYDAMMEKHRTELHRAECVIHSDQGSQYLSTTFQKLLSDDDFIQSVSGRGNSQDNAPMESFFGRMKCELLDLVALCPDADSVAKMINGYMAAYNNQHYQCESRVEQELGKSGSNAAKDMTKQARQGADQGGGLDVR